MSWFRRKNRDDEPPEQGGEFAGIARCRPAHHFKARLHDGTGRIAKYLQTKRADSAGKLGWERRAETIDAGLNYVRTISHSSSEARKPAVSP